MKNLGRVHLNGLRALEAAARLGSLQKAADELGVTSGAISQHVLRAEAQLGRQVLERTRAGFIPTAFGATLLPRLTAGFRELDTAVAASLRRDDAILTISVAPVLASKWLVPRLSAYAARHPDIRVRLDATTRLVDPDADGVDVAIRVGPGGWPGVRAEFVLHQEVFPVCAPQLAQRLATPADLMRLPVVRDANSVLSWQSWLELFGLDEHNLPDGNTFNDAALALDAAIAGQGVMLGWQTLAECALRAGTLVAPFRERVRPGPAYYLVTSANRREERKVADFKAWIREEAAATDAMFA